MLMSFTNRQAWKAAQQNSDSCKAAVAHLTSGKVPHNKPGDQHNEMRHYIRHAKLAPDGLLITSGDSITYSPGQLKNKIIVPHNVAPGLLYHLHNQQPDAHPSMSQLKAKFNRTFYTWNLQPLLDSLYTNCYFCSVIQKQPLVAAFNESRVEVNHPLRYFHADIIRRNGQYIMLLVDAFSNLAQACLTNSEKAEDLKHSLISLSTPVRHPGPITISTDNATGFQSLQKKTTILDSPNSKSLLLPQTSSTKTSTQLLTRPVRKSRLSSGSCVLKVAKFPTLTSPKQLLL